MATEAIYTKSLGGAEDLLLDASNSPTVIQTRAGKELEITKINSSTIPYSGKFGDPSMVSIKDKLDIKANTVSSAYVIDTVDDFGTVPSGIDTVIVKDLNRGGTFIYDATQSAVNNGGTIFNGLVRQYSGAVNVKWFGVKYTDTYDLAIAQNNRSLIQSVCRSNSNVLFPKDDNILFICGAIHPKRSNLYIHQEFGCNIINYVENSEQGGGHLFGFALYNDPDNLDYTFTGTVENVIYRLDGDIITRYSPTDAGGTFNQNALGFFRSKNCQVIGIGGISECNHVGINFDGDADNCHIDINYVNNCSTTCLQIKGTETSHNTIKAKTLYNNKFDDTVHPTEHRFIRAAGNTVDIDIDYIESDCGKPKNIIGLYGVNGVANIKLGTVKAEGLHLIRMYATRAVNLKSCNYSNVQHIVAIAGDANIPKDIILSNVVCLDESVVATNKIISKEITPVDFERLIISQCDFTNVSTLASIADGLAVGYFDLQDTKMPSTYTYSLYQPRIRSKDLANYGDISFTFNTNDKYGIIRKITMLLVAGGQYATRYPMSVDIVTLQESDSADYKIYVNDIVRYVTATKTGTVITFTAPTDYRFSSAEGEYM